MEQKDSSQRFVPLAAHCFQNKGIPDVLPAAYFTAMLGKFDLKVYDEVASKNSSVEKVFIHPDWDFSSDKFDADISIAVLEEPIGFTNAIQPICLPSQSSNEVEGSGTIVGWGQSSKDHFHDTKPNKLMVPAINGTFCYPTFFQLGKISSHRMFCAGYENQSKAPCMGDSGGGFYLEGSSGWNIRGIISSALLDKDGQCDIEKFSLYTNVAWFIDWIDQVLQRAKEEVFQDVDFNCTTSFYTSEMAQVETFLAGF